MRKCLTLLAGAMLFIAACTSDNAKSDNENIPDELTPTDTTGTADDAAINTDNDQADQTDQSDPTDQSDNIVSDEVVTDEVVSDDIATDDIATDDLLTDEAVEGNGDEDVVETPDDDFDPAAAVACCVEIVKEWWRCAVEVYKTDQATACTD